MSKDPAIHWLNTRTLNCEMAAITVLLLAAILVATTSGASHPASKNVTFAPVQEALGKQIATIELKADGTKEFSEEKYKQLRDAILNALNKKRDGGQQTTTRYNATTEAQIDTATMKTTEASTEATTKTPEPTTTTPEPTTATPEPTTTPQPTTITPAPTTTSEPTTTTPEPTTTTPEPTTTTPEPTTTTPEPTTPEPTTTTPEPTTTTPEPTTTTPEPTTTAPEPTTTAPKPTTTTPEPTTTTPEPTTITPEPTTKTPEPTTTTPEPTTTTPEPTTTAPEPTTTTTPEPTTTTPEPTTTTPEPTTTTPTTTTEALTTTTPTTTTTPGHVTPAKRRKRDVLPPCSDTSREYTEDDLFFVDIEMEFKDDILRIPIVLHRNDCEIPKDLLYNVSQELNNTGDLKDVVGKEVNDIYRGLPKDETVMLAMLQKFDYFWLPIVITILFLIVLIVFSAVYCLVFWKKKHYAVQKNYFLVKGRDNPLTDIEMLKDEGPIFVQQPNGHVQSNGHVHQPIILTDDDGRIVPMSEFYEEETQLHTNLKNDSTLL